MSVTKLEEVIIKVCIPKVSDKELHMFNFQGVRNFVDIKEVRKLNFL